MCICCSFRINAGIVYVYCSCVCLPVEIAVDVTMMMVLISPFPAAGRSDDRVSLLLWGVCV